MQWQERTTLIEETSSIQSSILHSLLSPRAEFERFHEYFLLSSMSRKWLIEQIHLSRLGGFFGNRILHCVTEESLLLRRHEATFLCLAAGQSQKRALDLLKYVAPLFERAQIPVMPLKGALLALTQFKSDPYRVMTDLDILIDEENLSLAVELLEAEGFRVAGGSNANRFHRQTFTNRGFRQEWAETGRQSFASPLGAIDLHWQPSYVVAGHPIVVRTERMWEDSVPCLELKGIRLPSAKHSYEYLMLHSSGFPSASYIYDLVTIQRALKNEAFELDLVSPSADAAAADRLEEAHRWLSVIAVTGFNSESEFRVAYRSLRASAQSCKVTLSFSWQILLTLSRGQKALFIAGYFLPDSHFYSGVTPFRAYFMHLGRLFNRTFQVVADALRKFLRIFIWAQSLKVLKVRSG